MDRGATQFSQSGLPSPYSSSFGDHHSEGSSAEHASAAQYPGKQDYPTSVTPTSEYSVYPPSARSGSFSADHIQRSYHPSSSASSGGMAQQQNSPSMPQHNGPSHQAHPVNSDNDVPIDPSIAAPSPTYPYGQHSPYAPNPDMSHGYSHQSGGMYAQPRPDWAGYSQHGAPPLTPGHPVYAQSPASAPQQRPSQVRICVQCSVGGARSGTREKNVKIGRKKWLFSSREGRVNYPSWRASAIEWARARERKDESFYSRQKQPCLHENPPQPTSLATSTKYTY